MASSEESTTGYRSSLARELLHQDVRNGTIPEDMSAAVAFSTRPEFAQFAGARLFPGRLSAVRKQNQARIDRSASEMEALQHDRRIHPRPTENYRGEPQWEGSLAQKLLLKDILELEKHTTMKPVEIWSSRDEYSLFDKDHFRDKIYQIQRTDKFKKHMEAKRKSKESAKK